MSNSPVVLDSFQGVVRDQAVLALASLQSDEGASIPMGGELKRVIAQFIALGIGAGGVTYGALTAEITPEQAGKILGISRPLVVQRMEDGRLPFYFVGTHRRCKLKDVLELKEREDTVNGVVAQTYRELDILEFNQGKHDREMEIRDMLVPIVGDYFLNRHEQSPIPVYEHVEIEDIIRVLGRIVHGADYDPSRRYRPSAKVRMETQAAIDQRNAEAQNE